MNYLNGGYVMIKHNATQKDLAAAYKSNRPVLVYDENQKAHWAQINETVTTETIDDEVVTTYTYSYQLINDVASLVDSAGNPRFIEGEGTLTEITGVTYTYNKWSLSGTHLMIVLAGAVANTTAVTTQNLVVYNLPSFINDKIVPSFGSRDVVIKSEKIYSASLSAQDVQFRLQKDSGTLAINVYQFTASADRTFRVQFDLLIDTDYSE